MKLREWLDRESRATPEIADVYEAVETHLLECDFQRAELGEPELICDADAPPRYWEQLFVCLDRARRAAEGGCA